MFRNVLALGLSAIIGVVALKLVFGIAGGLLGTVVGLFLWLVGLAIRLVLVGLVLYLILRILSPETARRVRARFNDAF
ncbi:MAG TPA: hypothetical protein VGD56_17205 [Gemmatirosa sp.]